MKLGRILPFSILAILAAGCEREVGLFEQDPDPNGGGVCQSGEKCCQAEDLVCTGDPDKGTVICTCYKDWDCDSNANPKKCSQNPANTPDGKTGWDCSVSGATETCSKSGAVPLGKNGWTCKTTVNGKVECSRPTNTPDGSNGWNCTYAKELKTCDKTTSPKTDGGGGSSTDSGYPPGWNCQKESNGSVTCKKPGTGSGYPPGGGSWMCYWSGSTITCEGSPSSPPGSNGWSCKKTDEFGGYRCTKTDTGDKPDGTQKWACVSGSTYNGIVCILLPPKGSSNECYAGQKMWCDGWTYCGYGQVVCGSDGKWAKKLNPKTGKVDYDCQELSDGSRPNTICACYFYKYNKSCCENPDCIIPAGTKGQICAKSSGKFCDYCNPTTPECVGTDSLCVVTAQGEHFCGQDCAGGKTCPTGSMCTAVSSSYQCIPNDQSCYY